MKNFFAEYGQIVAQVLLADSAVDRHRYTNSRNTFQRALLEQKVIPIVNENDAASLDELKIGDNDNMSALVAGIVDTDVDVILSDGKRLGLYTADASLI